MNRFYCLKHTILLLCIFLFLCTYICQAGESQVKFVVKPVPVTDVYEAMGTIRPLTEFSIHSQINAKIIDVLVSPGDRVEQGELLVRLDDREVVSRLEQVKEGISIAERGVEQAIKIDEELIAEFEQAETDYARSSKLHEKGIHSKKEFDQAKTKYLKIKAQLGQSKERVSSAKASLRQAEQMGQEAGLFAEYANIRAINSGIITKREAEPGDLATPSRSLLTIQTGSTLRLETGVRESLIDKVKIGMLLEAKIGSQKTVLTGKVEEIEPYADAKTRSFMVKVGIPITPGVFPGMFGRLLIPLDTVNALVIPAEAVTTIGQLKYVRLLNDKDVERVFVKTIERQNGEVEVLSGLIAGDTIVY